MVLPGRKSCGAHPAAVQGARGLIQYVISLVPAVAPPDRVHPTRSRRDCALAKSEKPSTPDAKRAKSRVQSHDFFVEPFEPFEPGKPDDDGWTTGARSVHEHGTNRVLDLTGATGSAFSITEFYTIN